jgi:hypothetical protein
MSCSWQLVLTEGQSKDVSYTHRIVLFPFIFVLYALHLLLINSLQFGFVTRFNAYVQDEEPVHLLCFVADQTVVMLRLYVTRSETVCYVYILFM